MDHIITLYALRYAIGKQNQEVPNVAKYIVNNMQDMSCEELKEILEELKAYYSKHTEDNRYLDATILAVAIKRELYGER